MQDYDYTYPEQQPYIGHPMKGYISFWACEKEGCADSNISISNAGYTVHPHSGDCYGSYTSHCAKCGKIESNSFSDN
jgi:hypothetical protein